MTEQDDLGYTLKGDSSIHMFVSKSALFLHLLNDNSHTKTSQLKLSIHIMNANTEKQTANTSERINVTFCLNAFQTDA